mmetsp:Transcript_12509/g.29011  ORF Transcript_12509/g.29011 Transcript_12509/m.29011 type:complete len:348 (+) Transcript_12509:84-1127(+)|eukprot:CAMPEP_0116862462 /NCGR_PEP_ID=MMETSP0418-20121206/23648_1 /TAXON_ID=1158023 /ORGANISM="Astrosyne radiata, Strain 13vi08-1A" /LENGTH=347 /DNA_ID=CAMNT_0004497311 /DNA_START=20 /DNA_END=1063 /DNA_ORIENTATION=-
MVRSDEKTDGVELANQWYDDWIKDLPDLTGKVAIITGSNSGTGFWAANAMAFKGCTVILACRSVEKGKHAKDEILGRYPEAKLDVMRLDNLDLDSVREFVKEFKSKYTELNYLVNNAGIMAQPYSLSKDGFEVQFQTNHLGHFLLTQQLWDMLVNTPGESRVVQHSSAVHKLGSPIFDKTKMEAPTYSVGFLWFNVFLWHVIMPFVFGMKPIDNWMRYGVSKLCNVLFMRDLKKKIEHKKLSDKVLSTACHPGYASTQLQLKAADSMQNWKSMNQGYAQSAADGSMPLLMATCGHGVKNGDYIGPSNAGEMKGLPKVVSVGGNGKDEAQGNELWEYSEECLDSIFEI